MTWQVLPEGSDQPVDQGQGSSYEDCVQQAFQSAQSQGAGAPADPSAAPAGPPVGDPTKVSSKTADSGVPAASESAKPDERTEVDDLPNYETMEDGGDTYSRKDYDHNSFEQKRKLDDSTYQNGWDKEKKAAVVRVSSTKAAELVDAYIEHGIVPNNRTAKYAAIGEVSKLSRETVQDRLNLLAEVEKASQRVASRPRNTVPRMAAKVPNLTRSASTSSASSDAENLFGL